ncbi:MAG: prenyltransferase [Anaerolineales bacterium]|nr:prenyltransferase [Anaerolineales bacterium]
MVKAILKLTRWSEFWAFTTILTWLGGLTAHHAYKVPLDWRLGVVLIANLAAMAYAFMINDIEDAPDDALDPNRPKPNPVATQELSLQVAWIATGSMAVVAALGYAVAGWKTFVVGIVTLVLAHLYSWKPVRLKARPLVDILSHALFLSTLLFLASYFLYADKVGEFWVVIIGTFLISANGQLYNQVRDFEGDRIAKLHNTASILGKQLTNTLATGSVLGSLLCLIIAALIGIFPLWLGPIFLVSIPISLFVLRGWSKDMRGDETQDPMALVQSRFLLAANLTLMTWLVVSYTS